jgi:hypothetical protein
MRSGDFCARSYWGDSRNGSIREPDSIEQGEWSASAIAKCHPSITDSRIPAIDPFEPRLQKTAGIYFEDHCKEHIWAGSFLTYGAERAGRGILGATTNRTS